MTAAGATTVQVAYASVALFSLNQVAPWLEHNRRILSVIAAMLMGRFALKILRPRRRLTGELRGATTASLLQAYVTAVLFNSFNPMLLVLLIGSMASVLGPELPDAGSQWLVLLGLSIGSFGWWVTLGGIVTAVQGHLRSAASRIVNKVAAAGLIGFGIVALLRALAR